MNHKFNVGDKKTYYKVVKTEDVAAFEGGVVHEVCSTFALAREIEWSSRLFILEMKEENEEGIGTLLEIEHRSPAMVGDELTIEATVLTQEKNELICEIEVKVGERLIALGKTGQKILKKDKLNAIFGALKQ